MTPDPPQDEQALSIRQAIAADQAETFKRLHAELERQPAENTALRAEVGRLQDEHTRRTATDAELLRLYADQVQQAEAELAALRSAQGEREQVLRELEAEMRRVWSDEDDNHTSRAIKRWADQVAAILPPSPEDAAKPQS